MKEMQIFEVGFKNDFSNSAYHDKFYVVAESAGTAEIKARKWLEDDAIEWNGDGDPEETKRYIKFVKELRLARLHHVGKTIV